MESALPSASESGLGEVDNSAICVGVGAKQKRENYKTSTLMKIVIKSQNILKTNQTARCFQSKYPTIRESTVRSFLKKYSEQVRIEKTLNQPPVECITNLT